jgi:hypothetical protein
MISFLFWNINKKSLLEQITWLVHNNDIDVLILAESELNDGDVLKTINLRDRPCFTIMPFGLSSRIKMYSRFSHRFIKPISDESEIAIRQIIPPIGPDILLVAAHLSSKLHQKDQDQFFNCTEFARKIEKAEDKVGHTRTLIIGDLNMNPFESGMVGAAGIHAVSDRRIASKGTRLVNGKTYRFFYNPMWNYFGDTSPKPCGTYFYDTGTQVNLYWNVFDQVLIRPELLETFSDENLRIVTQIGSNSLLSKLGRPDSSFASDHLPILLTLNL